MPSRKRRSRTNSLKLLVICSGPSGRNFPQLQKDIYKMLHSKFPRKKRIYTQFADNLLQEDKVISMDFPTIFYPEGPLYNRKYDAIWFCGCNRWDNLFYQDEKDDMKTYELLQKALTKNGIVFFTESKNWSKKTKRSEPNIIPFKNGNIVYASQFINHPIHKKSAFTRPNLKNFKKKFKQIKSLPLYQVKR